MAEPEELNQDKDMLAMLESIQKGGTSPNSPLNEEQTGPAADFRNQWELDRMAAETDGGTYEILRQINGGKPPYGAAAPAAKQIQEQGKGAQAARDPLMYAMLKELNGGQDPYQMSPVGIGLQADAAEEVEAKRTGREPTGIFSGVVDVLSRFQYAEAAMIDTLLESELGVKALGNTLVRGFQEFFSPVDRLSFSDLIEKYNPEFANKHPAAATVIGVAMDVAFDPTTYLTFGVGGAGKAVKVTKATGDTLFLTSKGAAKLTRLTKVSQRYIADELITDVAKFDWAESKIVKMAETDPTLFFPKGFQIHMNVPVSGRRLITLLEPAQAKAFADTTGLTAIRNAVKTYTDSNVLLQSVKGTFRRVGDLPKQYLKEANMFLSDAEGAADTIIKATAKMAKGLNKEGAVKIGKAAHKISDELMSLTANGEPLTNKLVSEVQHKWFSELGLGEKEINVYSEMRRGLVEMRQAELNVGLQIKQIAEYFPRYYDNVIRSADDTGTMYKHKRFTDKLKAAKSRVFKNIKDAEDAGLNPEWNAVEAFSMRAQASRKAIAKATFDKKVEKLIKHEGFDKKTIALIKRDAREIGDSMHPDFDKAWMNALVNANDIVVNSVFRPAATILKPGFATFQALSNTVQMMWAGGFKLGARSSMDVGKHIIDNVGTGLGGKYWESMRKTLWNIDPNGPRLDSSMILKYLDDPAKLKGSRITTDIGTSFSGEEMAMMVKQMRVAQGTSVLGVPGFHKTAMGELRRTNAVAWTAEKTGASEGFVDFMSTASTYWNWPRMVEDMARTNFFMNAVRQGHAPHEALRLVNKALYDYTGGLSKFERMWVKRVMPFYSFTRFTLPLAADVATTRPGRLANTARGLKAFFATWQKARGGEDLNETERHSIPGWILEQPSTFAKFDLDGRAIFNAFTNWTPLDAVNFLEHGDSERGAMERTVQKSILSMITPMIKLPMEHVMNTNFFTGRALKDIYRMKDRLGTDSSVWQAADKVLTAGQKEAMGWEMGTDIRTGKKNVYINPYITHYMTGVAPLLNNVIRVFDGDLNWREKAMWTFANISTYKIDMQDQYRRTVRARRAAIQEKRQQINFLRGKGLEGSAEEYQHELQELLGNIQADAAEEQAEPRGPGNMPEGGF